MRKLLGDTTPAEFAQVALLLTSEIVSNAAAVGGGCRLSAWYAPEALTLRVEVEDHSSEIPDVPGPPEPAQLSGRGLRVVDALASRWGIERRGTGKAVWFEIRRDPSTIGMA